MKQQPVLVQQSSLFDPDTHEPPEAPRMTPDASIAAARPAEPVTVSEPRSESERDRRSLAAWEDFIAGRH